LPLQPRPEIEGLTPGIHGGPDHEELSAAGLKPEDVLDFSVCGNPFMPPPGTMKSLSEIPIGRYPDSGATELRERLAAVLGIPAGNIIAGSGTTELIRLIALAYFRKNSPVLMLEPTFGDYEVAGKIMGAKIIKFPLREEDGFLPRMDVLADLIRNKRPAAAFICNPNNPTGRYLDDGQVAVIREALGEGLLVLDEAYISFVENSGDSLELARRTNTIVLRSMTKDYGISGLRLGYAVAPLPIVAAVRTVCPPWNVNIVAQRAGIALLEKTEYLEDTKPKIREAGRFLVREITRLGYVTVPSDANYFLVKVGHAAGFRAALLKKGILVRDCSSFGLPDHVRIAPRTMPECRRLIEAIPQARTR